MKPLAPVNPGRLRQRVAMEEKTSVSDGAGGLTDFWVPVAHLFAAIEPQTIRAKDGADQTIRGETFRVLLRSGVSVTSDMRIAWQGRCLAIETVRDPDMTGRYIECIAREDTP